MDFVANNVNLCIAKLLNWRKTGDLHLSLALSFTPMGKICREQQGIAELEMLCPNITYLYKFLLAAIEDQKHPHHQAEVDLASPVAILISLSSNS